MVIQRKFKQSGTNPLPVKKRPKRVNRKPPDKKKTVEE